MDAQFWDDRYRSQDQLFSGHPNGVLVTEVTDLPPGRALDVGCGEGADAIWLARRGWQVTGVDISQVALDRAADAAARAGVEKVTWTRADLSATPPQAGAYDLVSAQYFPLRRRADHVALRALIDAVAPGGTLLFVGHDLADLTPDNPHAADAHQYYRPDEIPALLDDTWTVLVDGKRPRTAPGPPGTHHTHDTVLRCVRTASAVA
ncbi:class I SAM-dependent methyltransferase [Saccharopolyspora rosea]|uniref:Class I SAM-dependent methyltransferase n=1 Tax=Saccharopolyspora rosea TaxID=524884 RepID=A0ABW3FLJ1_9PSEU|nr:class I SAM-dependent methyltransferase [Saccharopolyspora rosea]